jgi:hypothetical protein
MIVKENDQLKEELKKLKEGKCKNHSGKGSRDRAVIKKTQVEKDNRSTLKPKERQF